MVTSSAQSSSTAGVSSSSSARYSCAATSRGSSVTFTTSHSLDHVQRGAGSSRGERRGHAQLAELAERVLAVEESAVEQVGHRTANRKREVAIGFDQLICRARVQDG